jgi:cell division protein FtsB
MIHRIFALISDTIDRRFLIIGSVIAFLGIYLGILLFGENSILTYFKLRSEKQNLTNKIIELKNSNAVLQKKYFELKQQNRNRKEN